MTSPCAQESEIRHINSSVDRMERTLERVVLAIERVAEQSARIEAIEERNEHTSNDIETMFNRVRDLELNQAAYGPEARLQFNNIVEEMTSKIDEVNARIEKILRFYRLTTGRNAMYIYSGILIVIGLGFYIDLSNHAEVVKELWKFWKG